MKTTGIVMTMHRRPAYTRLVLDSLARCKGFNNHAVYLLCDQGCDEVAGIAEEFERLHANTAAYFQAVRVGCNVNTLEALSVGFANHERVIALEDDTVPGRDFLEFCNWGLDAYENDKSVFSICGYQRTPPSETYATGVVFREQWFTPWGWATWRDRWESIRDKWPLDDAQVSWDTVIDHDTRGRRSEVRPVVARIQNVGAVDGAHVPSAEWHQHHHFNPNWIETHPPVGDSHGTWLEVHQEATTALRRHHPC